MQAKKITLAALAALSIMSSAAFASTVTYNIYDLSNEGQPITNTYSGTGYVGMYGTQVGQRFNGIFGLEQSAFSRTALEVNISALTGATINSAHLLYTVNGGSQSINMTTFTANGTLGYFWDAPDTLLSGSATSVANSNSIDVTNFLQAGLSTNTGWFGLALHGTDQYQWIGANRNSNADAAQVRLVVDFTEGNQVPEPANLALLGVGLIGLAASRCRKTT